MTFSILATDGEGAVGMAVTSSSPAVAARCIHLRSGVGAAASQNVTDPRLGTALLDRLQEGRGARAAMDEVVTASPDIDHRQLSVVDIAGEGAAWSGSGSLGVHHHVVGPQLVAAGNLLARHVVVDAVSEGFLGRAGELEERLLAGLQAGLQAGGEAGPLRSAGLAVARKVPWRETDLRVDWSESPIEQLAELLAVWLPQRDAYVTRALHPSSAPSYGVPGDE